MPCRNNTPRWKRPFCSWATAGHCFPPLGNVRWKQPRRNGFKTSCQGRWCEWQLILREGFLSNLCFHFWCSTLHVKSLSGKMTSISYSSVFVGSAHSKPGLLEFSLRDVSAHSTSQRTLSDLLFKKIGSGRSRQQSRQSAGPCQ